jgi:outer membrane autotransporter protein
MDTKRTVTLAGGGPLNANFDAQTYGARIEGGYRFGFAGLGVTPYAAVQAVAIELPAYSERPGANPFALSYSSRSESALRTELGSWFETVLAPLQAGVLIARARAAWAHDEGADQGVTAAFQNLPGTTFVVTGAAAPKNLALLTAATELRLANGLSLGGRIDGELASTAAAYDVRGEIKWRW